MRRRSQIERALFWVTDPLDVTLSLRGYLCLDSLLYVPVCPCLVSLLLLENEPGLRTSLCPVGHGQLLDPTSIRQESPLGDGGSRGCA